MSHSPVVHTKIVGPFGENTYLVGDPETKSALLIDPGDEAEVLLKFIEKTGLIVRYILNTHGHIDHLGAVADIQTALKVPFGLCEKDGFLLENLGQMAAFLGLKPPPTPQVDLFLKEGDQFEIGSHKFEVLSAPGHTPGHLLFYTPGHVFVGDCLFAGSIGRTDLPGGDHRTLLTSIENKIFTLPPSTVVYSGHGPTTTVKRERETNPFFT